MKTNTQPKLHISLSKEHSKYQSDVADAFKDLDISFDGGLMRFSAQEMAMQVMLNLGLGVVSSAMWDAIKFGIKKLHKKFNKVRITLRDADSIMYTVKPDLSVTVLAVPDRMKEFTHIKTLNDLVVHLQNKSNADISKDWKKVTLGDLFDFKNGLNSEKENFGHGVRFINIMEILKHDSLVAKDIPGRINVDPKRNKENIVEYGDVLFNRTSETPDEVGMTSVYLDHEPVVFGGFVIRAKPKTKELDDLFKKYCFSSEKFRKEVIKQGQGVVRGNIGQSNLRVIPFLLPSKEEQVRIASVLETWNQVIRKMEDKIEIKKQVKNGLIQNLLSGKNRLGEFNDKWEILMLGDICKISTGKKDVNEGNPLGIYPFFTCAKNHTFSDSYSFDTEAILIAGNGDVGNCQYYNGKFEAYQRTYVLTDVSKDIQYVFSYLNYFFQNTINSQKQMGAMPYIKIGMLEEYQIKIPKSEKEQKAISKILTTADKEITELEKKLQIIKEQKKYLLNNLITGAIRTPETLSTRLTK
jgi:type I restriction enzyme S subunit